MSDLQKLIFGRRNWGSYNHISTCQSPAFLLYYQKTSLAQIAFPLITCSNHSLKLQGVSFCLISHFSSSFSHLLLIGSQSQVRCPICRMYSYEALLCSISRQFLFESCMFPLKQMCTNIQPFFLSLLKEHCCSLPGGLVGWTSA